MLEGLLGRGGMGCVFAACDLKRGVRVALKLMHAHLGNVREAQFRFRNEASALHKLRSDHVARLYDFGHHESGAPYLVMEHVPGHDLTREVARSGRLRWGDAQAIVDQMCRGLEAVHAAGLIHRDLKPRNVVLVREGQGLSVKLVDFGLSKSSGAPAHPPITREGMTVGSLHYMAPEQAVGSPHVDARADVFSVGCILYFLLTGEPPFSPRAVARAGRAGAPLSFLPLCTRRPDVPSYVDEVLRVALASTPDERFRTIGALRMALASDIPVRSTEAALRAPSPASLRTLVLVILPALCTAALVLALRWLLAR